MAFGFRASEGFTKGLRVGVAPKERRTKHGSICHKVGFQNVSRGACRA